MTRRSRAKKEIRDVATPAGLARITWMRSAGAPRALMFLGHGAGGGIDAPDLVRVSEMCNEAAIHVGLVEQPYRVAGKAIGSDRAKLDAAFTAVVEAERRAGLPIIVGGRSAGARVACRTAEALRASAVVALAFPLWPPKTPERSRASELSVVTKPLLVVQGTRDPFGGPNDLPRGTRVHVIEGGDHSFNVLRSTGHSPTEVLDEIGKAVRDFALEILRDTSSLH